VFTAFITLPEGHDVADINLSSVECEGESAIRGVVAGDTFIAKFNRQDMVGILEPDGEETLTVTGELNGGLSFEGSDTIRVIDSGGG